MLGALTRAIGDLFLPRVLGLLSVAIALSAGCFVAVWFGIDALLAWWSDGSGGGAAGWRSWLGGFGALVLAWFLFPLVAASFVAMFLDQVAAAVEARHYPQLPPAPGLPWHRSLAASLRFLGVLLLANAALLLTWLVPPVYPVAWLLVNGWLMGREYFELVALRRLDPSAARTLRAGREGELLLTGVLLAALAMLPLLNLVVPVLATAVLVHRVTAWHRAG
jgi:CysZ protein